MTNATANNTALSRRTMLKTLAVAGFGAALPRFGFGQPAADANWRAALTTYLESLARPDGGYAWGDQEQSHLTPAFSVIGCYRLLGQTPPRKSALAAFVRSHHPNRLAKMEQEHREFEYQQIQALLWLGEDASSFTKQVAGWKKPLVYLKQYEQQGFPILRHESTAFICRKLLGMPLDGLVPDYVAYLNSRRRANGSYNNTPAADKSDGHVLNTWWGLQALEVLGRLDEKQAETIAWLRSCQLANGGFTWQPNPPFAGVDDVAYTRAALRSLQKLGGVPAQREACARYLCSLANEDGGFGDRPGWLSNPVATYYALDALAALGELNVLADVRRNPAPARISLPAGLKVFTVQVEAHGNGSPAEAVELARSLRIHLWGAKNGTPEWLQTAQAVADQKNVPVKFFVANEEYGTWVYVAGLGTYSHTSDVLAPANCNFGRPMTKGHNSRYAVSWPEFRTRRLDPLQKASGRLIWQFGENEELVRLYLDDTLERGGYAALSTYHFGNPDFTNTEPFLQRYRGHIPFIALQDAHGREPWWFADKTTGFRTVFLAAEPTYEAFLQALERDWVVAIRHDAVSGFKTWMHGGRPEVVEYVRQHDHEWRWWDNPGIERPMVSLQALTPRDKFEIGRPGKGVTLRVRCAYENTTGGAPTKPISKLVKLTVDGQEVTPQFFSVRDQRHPVLVAPKYAVRRAGRQGPPPVFDFHYEYPLPAPTPGRHTATAMVEVVATQEKVSQSVEFQV